MGKKIPSKKHNKLKAVDPFNNRPNSVAFQGEDEMRNRAPRKLTQEAPRALKRMFDLEQDEPVKKKKKKSDRMSVRTVNHRDDSSAIVSQNTYESDAQFLRRVSQMANRAREQADISKKFDVRFMEDGTAVNDAPHDFKAPTRRKRRLQQLKEKKKAKLLKKLEPVEEAPKEFPKRDVVAFGEIVHAPPEITAKVRGAPEGDTKRTAKNLLCNPDKTVKIPDRSKAKFSGEKVRWKNLEKDKRQELEEERKRVIEAYRKLRNK